jgi:hypothetical protein
MSDVTPNRATHSRGAQSRQYEYRDLTDLSRWTIRLLYADVILSVVALVSGALEFQLLQSLQGGAYASQEAAAMEAADANDTRQQLIAWLELGLLIACAVAVLKWIYRANANARALGAKDMKFTPGWAVGWYFVPILFCGGPTRQ